jgi:hypothetical protein
VRRRRERPEDCGLALAEEASGFGTSGLADALGLSAMPLQILSSAPLAICGADFLLP